MALRNSEHTQLYETSGRLYKIKHVFYNGKKLTDGWTIKELSEGSKRFCISRNVRGYNISRFSQPRHICGDKLSRICSNSASIKSLRPKLQFFEAMFWMHDLPCGVLLILLFFDKSRLKRYVTRYSFHFLTSRTRTVSPWTLFSYFFTFFTMWLSKSLSDPLAFILIWIITDCIFKMSIRNFLHSIGLYMAFIIIT
jgi:hypothetical protein